MKIQEHCSEVLPIAMPVPNFDSRRIVKPIILKRARLGEVNDLAALLLHNDEFSVT